MSFRRLIVCFTFLAIFTMAVRFSVDSDTWWHLRAGEHILDTREIIRQDPFSLTRQGQSWIYPGWLAQVLLFKTYELFGFQGLNLLTAVFIVLAFACIWPLLEGPALMRASVLLLAASVSGVYWSARPQIMSFTLSGLFLLVLWKARDGRRRVLWFLPLIMALWVNLHGGFAIGFIFILCFLVAEVMESFMNVARDGMSLSETWFLHRRSILQWVAVGVMCALAVVVNPHGGRMLLYPFQTVSVGALQDYIQEWQSPNFHNLETQPFLWMFLLIVASISFSDKSVTWLALILVIGFAYMSFLAARNIALFALVAAPVLCEHAYAALRPITKRRKKGRQVPERVARLLNLAIFILMILAACVKILVPMDRDLIQEAISDRAPVEAVTYIREHNLNGPLFNSYNWGGYVIWALYPQSLSFVDGRTDLFDDEILLDYITAWRADSGWEKVLAEWEIEVALLETGSPLTKVLQLTGWNTLYEDQDAVVLTIGESQ